MLGNNVEALGYRAISVSIQLNAETNKSDYFILIRITHFSVFWISLPVV